MNGRDVTKIIFCIFIMISVYFLSIILSIRIQDGEDSLNIPKIRTCFVTAIFGMSFNVIDFIVKDLKNISKNNIVYLEVFFILCAIYKIYGCKGNLLWDPDDEYEETGNPFKSTIGMSICILSSYTFPIKVLIGVTVVITLANSVMNINKYKISRFVPICILNIIEIKIASCLVELSYNFPFSRAILAISLIGLIFNIIISSINDIVFDRITGDRFIM